MERWRPVEGADRYLVSNEGRVKRKGADRILKTPIDKYNRPKIAIQFDDGDWHHVIVSKLVALAWVDGYEEGLEVGHLDGDPSNNRAENLKWMTSKELRQYGFREGFRKVRRPLRTWQIEDDGTWTQIR